MPMGDNNNGQRYFVSIRNEKDDVTDPHFQVKINTGPKQYERRPDVQWILGYLYKVEKGGYEYKGEWKRTAKFHFKSGEETYVLEGTYTSIMRSIINSLAGADAYGAILLRLYINKDDFPSIWCQNVADGMDWKYSWDEQMKAAGWQPGVHDKKMPDEALARLNTFFEGVLLNDIQQIIESSPSPPPEEPQYIERAAKKKDEDPDKTLEEEVGMNEPKSIDEANAQADSEQGSQTEESPGPSERALLKEEESDLPF